MSHDILALAKRKDVKYGIKCENHKGNAVTEVNAANKSQQSASDLLSTEDFSSEEKRIKKHKRPASPESSSRRKRISRTMVNDV